MSETIATCMGEEGRTGEAPRARKGPEISAEARPGRSPRHAIGMDRIRWRTPLAVVGALVVAEAAVLLLRPREGVIEPARVSPTSYFTAEQLDRADRKSV